MKFKSIMVVSLTTIIATSAIGQVLNSEDRRPGSSLQSKVIYQWTDPKTGKPVRAEYPPSTNLSVREISRQKEGINTIVILEVKQKEKDSFFLMDDGKEPKKDGTTDKKASYTDASAACLAAAKERITYKDPSSLRIEGTPKVDYTTATGVVRQSITIMVNAKNSFGAYTGAKPVTCVLGTDNITVIAISGG